MSDRRGFATLLVGFLALLVLAGCNNLSGRVTAAPRVSIAEPASEETVPTGREVRVKSVAAGETPIERIDLYVNDELIRSDTSPIEGGQYTFNVVQLWVPIQPGRAEIKVVAYDVNGTPSRPAGIVLNVVGEGMVAPEGTAPPEIGAAGTAPASPTAPVVPLSEGTPVNVGSPVPNATVVEVFTPVPAPTGTPAPAASGATTGIGGTVAVSALNVRSGPGESYAVVGSLRYFATVTATGRNQDTSWARVTYAQNRTGWVATRFITWDRDISQLPVVQP